MMERISDVDIVYTWVNHLDPHWQSLYRHAIESGGVPAGLHASVNDMARFQNRDEIRYSVNSVKKYAPWVRNIFIVTNCELPSWATKDPQIISISHETIFPETADLPTFNAFAIEACLHRVPDLSERFIYFNDDVFLLRPMEIADFFPEKDHVSVFVSKHDIPKAWREGLRPVEYSMLNVRDILIERFGYDPEKKLEHAPFPLLKSLMCQMEKEYPDQVVKTRSHAFRHPTDIPLSTTLHAYYCAATGRGHIRYIPSRYIDIGDPLFIFLILPYSPLMRKKYTFLCLNEVTSMRWLPRLRDRIVKRLMKKLFPTVRS
jgi:hypothetical protein